jgi:hypothetical protein
MGLDQSPFAGGYPNGHIYDPVLVGRLVLPRHVQASSAFVYELPTESLFRWNKKSSVVIQNTTGHLPPIFISVLESREWHSPPV